MPRRCRPTTAVRALALVLLSAVLLFGSPPAVAGQSAGRILGQVTDRDSGEPLAGAQVELLRYDRGTLANEEGRFIIVAVPPGEHAIRVTMIGYQTQELEGVQVRADRATQVDVELRSEAVEVEGVVAEVERIRLVEPEINVTHEVVLGTELREMPLDAVEEAVELAPGVSDGHFRGGRIGQEVYVVDGLEFKNQFEASSQGSVLELPPTALQEVEVVTGGFGAQFGTALSGVVRYVTRRGDPEEWEGRASFRTDHWAPDGIFRGFNALSASAGGPLSFLSDGTTLYADVLLHGMRDADPRARGLTCLEPQDADADLAGLIRTFQGDARTRSLHCPFTDSSFPHQKGEKVIGFLRLDHRFTDETNLSATLLRNRLQRQLYTSEFKYNPTYQLGQKAQSTLATLSLNWNGQGTGRGFRVTARGSALRIDRYLGVVDPGVFEDRTDLGGFGLSEWDFLGEDFVRRDINEQLREGGAVPGYREPGGFTGSPFGPAAEGIFFTEGTPDIANWTRTEFLGGDLEAEVLSAEGHVLRGGFNSRFFRIQSYERVLAYLPGSAPNYTRFYPASVSGYAEVLLSAADEVTIQVGGRVDAFKAGLDFREDRADFNSPVLETGWKATVTPRIGVSAPIPGTEGNTAFRFNFSQVSQPPDFRFFLDTTIGDSLRTEIRRQGNPDLAFEKGTSYEAGISHRLGESLGLSLVGFRKELTNLVTGSLQFQGIAENQFTTGDFGTVNGVELAVRGRWPGLRLRGGYALQKATGVVSGAFDESGPAGGGGDDEPEEPEIRREFPLDFDRRHSIDLAVFAGRAAGDPTRSWGLSVIGAVQSGFPFVRDPEAAGLAEDLPENLPWNYEVDVRLSREMGRVPGCDCTWRIMADGRNALDADNVRALRGATGTVAPSREQVQRLADQSVPQGPIPLENPRYDAGADLDRDGLITDSELRTVRQAAALDRFDPSLFFGKALQLRMGVEVTF